MQIPILNGVYTDTVSEFRSLYPRNMIPVAKNTGISQGYLRPADGISIFCTASSGNDRGGINWNGSLYRVIGSKFCKISSLGEITIIGDVGDDGLIVRMDYSFDRLAIVSNGKLYYFMNNSLTLVNDPDLGINIIDVIYIDGYFMLTDGISIVVTDLSDPTSINPLKYGSAEADPDNINSLLKIHNEAHAIGRYSIEIFGNVGGALFPFQRIAGAFIGRGCIGKRACAKFNDTVAMVGGAKNEPASVWLASNGQAVKIATREIDTILKSYPDNILSDVFVETRIEKNHEFLLIHLVDKTLVFDAKTSQIMGEPVWFILDSSSTSTFNRYKARGLVWCYNKWIFGDPTSSNIGYYIDNKSSHYGNKTMWEFGTLIAFNQGKGALIHQLELIVLSGNIPITDTPIIWTSYSLDGETWSQEIGKSSGNIGQRNIRPSWFKQGFMRNWRIQKFRGTSEAFVSVARLEAQVEGLMV